MSNYWEAKKYYECRQMMNKKLDFRYIEMKAIIANSFDDRLFIFYDASYFNLNLKRYKNYDFLNLKVDTETIHHNWPYSQHAEISSILYHWDCEKEQEQDFVKFYRRRPIEEFMIYEFYIKFNDVKNFKKIPVSPVKYIRKRTEYDLYKTSSGYYAVNERVVDV